MLSELLIDCEEDRTLVAPGIRVLRGGSALLTHVSTLQLRSSKSSVAEGWHATRAFAELLIDCEEDRTLKAVLVDMLREGDRGR